MICEITGRNPDVFDEAGIAHTLGREVILIIQSDNDVPFDLRHHRYGKYLSSAEDDCAQAATDEPPADTYGALSPKAHPRRASARLWTPEVPIGAPGALKDIVLARCLALTSIQ